MLSDPTERLKTHPWVELKPAGAATVVGVVAPPGAAVWSLLRNDPRYSPNSVIAVSRSRGGVAYIVDAHQLALMADVLDAAFVLHCATHKAET